MVFQKLLQEKSHLIDDIFEYMYFKGIIKLYKKSGDDLILLNSFTKVKDCANFIGVHSCELSALFRGDKPAKKLSNFHLEVFRSNKPPECQKPQKGKLLDLHKNAKRDIKRDIAIEIIKKFKVKNKISNNRIFEIICSYDICVLGKVRHEIERNGIKKLTSFDIFNKYVNANNYNMQDLF